MPSYTLEVAGSIVTVSRGGPPEAESWLFDTSDVVLEGSNRECGYQTRASAARQRLADVGITPEEAVAASNVAKPSLAHLYARGAAARCLVDHLEADELFEASAFDASSGLYEGRWLDVAALARDLGGKTAGAQLQALHLAAVLATVPDDAEVVLSIAREGEGPRPGERSLRRVDLSGIKALIAAMRDLRPARPRESGETGPSRADAIAWLRERAKGSTGPRRERFVRMESSLSMRDPPTRGPLAETALWNIENKLSQGETSGVLEQIDELERRRGRGPGTTYLRARLSLMMQTEDPAVIAERASALSTSMAGFHELELLAAQAWLAAGDSRRARAFARDLHEDAGADELLRMKALEVLDAAGPSSSTSAVVENADEAPSSSSRARKGGPESPTSEGGPSRSVETSRQSRPTAAPAASSPFTSAPASIDPITQVPSRQRGPSKPVAPLNAGALLPPHRVEPRIGPLSATPFEPDTGAVRVEMLALPAGAQSPPTAAEPPSTPAAARVMCTYLARELGRELRLQHSVDLYHDVAGLEIAQRYLSEAFVDGKVRTPAEERDLMRYGAFLSELVARRLGGNWLDLSSGSDSSSWAMLVPLRSRPEEVLRIWPFGRVRRFVGMRHKERDLVAYYLDLELRCGAGAC